MSKDPEISEMWTARIYFKGTSGTSKPRPVLVINFSEDTGLYTIQEITSIGPKTPPIHYDGFKQVIEQWKNSGLDEKSYVKCAPENTHNVERIRLKSYIGVSDEDDFEAIIQKILESRKKQSLR
ncbi:type II toxin-antitoxin system PemK/MazF family toxin [Paenibacillus donghaensis]|uniref:type II toxin-antitoxin system PemK/MazF family toxin n=1 Tax=Paenibacillus donghaensis TaxID=414771 RepID=UPI0012FDDE93|nr:type II toxin-antitoxin system PemK/MazF family toxin [Paenibacillus donghaensis]